MAKPEAMDVYEELWDKNKDLAEKILNLSFFQQMQKGDLQADKFINFTLQDHRLVSHYLYALNYYLLHVKTPTIKKLFVEKRDAYKRFLDEALKKVNLRAWAEIIPIPVEADLKLTQRSNFNVSATSTSDQRHIVYLIKLMARERLWKWLATQMQRSNDNNNAYFTWMSENMKWTPEDYKEVINDVIDSTAIDRCIGLVRHVLGFEYELCTEIMRAE